MLLDLHALSCAGDTLVTMGQLKFERPNEASANAKRLSENNFLNGDNSNYGAMYANKITVDCP